MSAICLSSASILRCAPLSQIQAVALIIPTTVEALFATYLLWAKWGDGKKHLLMTAEGWTYFAIALLDMLSHLIPAARDYASVYRVINIVLASLSSVPILLYVLFLLIYICTELIDHFPTRFRNVVKYMLLLLIPGIIIMNVVASFIGISLRTVKDSSGSYVAIGFEDDTSAALWTFFTSLTLAILTLYQAATFTITFYQLLRAFIDKRRIETTSSDEGHLINGLGWIAAGIKLGAIESVIGFAQGGFAGALTRRIFRLSSRVVLVIGVIKGADTLENYAEFAAKMKSSRRPSEFRRSLMRPFISNPRYSTFKHLDSESHPNDPSSSEKDGRRTGVGARERVTVHFNQHQTPILQLRFSTLDLPTSKELVDTIKSRPESEWLRSNASERPSDDSGYVHVLPKPLTRSLTLPTLTSQTGPASTLPSESELISASSLQSQKGRVRFKGATSDYGSQGHISNQSVGSDSLSFVRNIASQFPSLPSRPTTTNISVIREAEEPGTPVYSLSPLPIRPATDYGQGQAVTRSSSKRRPPEIDTTTTYAMNAFAISTDSPATAAPMPVIIPPSVRTATTRTPLSNAQASSTMGVSPFDDTPSTENPFKYDDDIDDMAHLPSPESRRSPVLRSQWIDATPRESRVTDADEVISIADITTYRRERNVAAKSEVDLSAASTTTFNIPWIPNPSRARTIPMPSSQDEEETFVLNSGVVGNAPTRIKSIGNAPRKNTPTPMRPRSQKSIVLEHFVPAAPAAGVVGSIGGVGVGEEQPKGRTKVIYEYPDKTMSVSGGGGVLRDSEVLGIEGKYDW